MKDNTQQTKALLQKALVEAPSDYALTDVRYHIRAALAKIETVEKHRLRRAEDQQRRVDARAQGNVYADPMRTLQVIDEMIAEEKAKIEEIQRRRTHKDEKDDGDELQTVLG